jgi:hypothetical protein
LAGLANWTISLYKKRLINTSLVCSYCTLLSFVCRFVHPLFSGRRPVHEKKFIDRFRNISFHLLITSFRRYIYVKPATIIREHLLLEISLLCL